MAIHFDTTAFRRSHMREPSRTVRGCWMFQVAGRAEPMMFNGTLPEAKAAIRRELLAAGKRNCVVDILP